MRILILAQYFPPEIGAPQVRLLAIAKEFQRGGHEVQVVTALPNYPTGRVYPEYEGRIRADEEIEGVPVRRMWLVAATGRGPLRLFNLISFCLTGFLGAAGLGRFDMVFVSSPPFFLGVPGWLLGKVHRAKFVFYVADLWPDTIAELGILKRHSRTFRLLESLEKWIYRKADLISTATVGIRNRIVHQKGAGERKVVFFPNGVNVELFTPDGPKEEIREGTSLFIYGGIHGYAQGLELLLDTALRLQHRSDIVIWMVGEGPTKAGLQAKALEMGLTNLQFHEARPLEEMPRLLRAARASIVPLVDSPLFADARPSKMFPAWACGIPTVFCGTGESADLVVDGGMGWVVPPQSPEALAQCLLDLADHPGEASERGHRGRAYVEANLGWPQIVGNWWEEVRAAGL